MPGFSLSPGITPPLVELFAIELPIAVGLGLVLGGARGARYALTANLAVLGAIKIATDWSDLLDVVPAAAAIVGAGLWAAGDRWRRSGRVRRGGLMALGVLFVGLGVLKLYLDPFDPFDVFWADLLAVSGVAVLWGLRRAAPAPPGPTAPA